MPLQYTALFMIVNFYNFQMKKIQMFFFSPIFAKNPTDYRYLLELPSLTEVLEIINI